MKQEPTITSTLANQPSTVDDNDRFAETLITMQNLNSRLEDFKKHVDPLPMTIKEVPPIQPPPIAIHKDELISIMLEAAKEMGKQLEKLEGQMKSKTK